MSYGDTDKMAVCAPGGLVGMRETLRTRLENRKKAAEEHLADVTNALKFLDDNPNFEAFHDLLGKTGF
jgi:hypothetical protein